MMSTAEQTPVAERAREKEETRMATWMAGDMVSAAAYLRAALSSAISTHAGASEIERLQAATPLLIPLEEEMEVGLVEHPQAILFPFIIGVLAGARHDARLRRQPA